jgi:hypothetical protein
LVGLLSSSPTSNPTSQFRATGPPRRDRRAVGACQCRRDRMIPGIMIAREGLAGKAGAGRGGRGGQVPSGPGPTVAGRAAAGGE